MECRVRMTGYFVVKPMLQQPGSGRCKLHDISGVPSRNTKFSSSCRCARKKRTQSCHGIEYQLRHRRIPGSRLISMTMRSLSNAAHGGSVTERHLMLALSRKILKSGKSPEDFLSEAGIALSEKGYKKAGGDGRSVERIHPSWHPESGRS